MGAKLFWEEDFLMSKTILGPKLLGLYKKSLELNTLSTSKAGFTGQVTNSKRGEQHVRAETVYTKSDFHERSEENFSRFLYRFNACKVTCSSYGRETMQIIKWECAHLIMCM